MDNKGWETKEEYKARRTEELNVIRTYECECGKTFKWKSKYYWSNRSGHHKTQTHIKKVENKRKKYKEDVKNAFSVLPNPLLNIGKPPSRE